MSSLKTKIENELDYSLETEIDEIVKNKEKLSVKSSFEMKKE